MSDENRRHPRMFLGIARVKREGLPILLGRGRTSAESKTLGAAADRQPAGGAVSHLPAAAARATGTRLHQAGGGPESSKVKQARPGRGGSGWAWNR
jgi:hypothetical protein